MTDMNSTYSVTITADDDVLVLVLAERLDAHDETQIDEARVLWTNAPAGSIEDVAARVREAFEIAEVEPCAVVREHARSSLASTAVLGLGAKP